MERYIQFGDVTVRTPFHWKDVEKPQYVSLDKIVNDDGDSYGDSFLEDRHDCIGELITMMDFEHMVDQLSPRTQKPMRCMLQGYGMTDTAKMCGISFERVRQIKKLCNRELVASEV